MADKRLQNRSWAPGDDTGNAPTWERVMVAILLDLRDELQKLNALLGCPNFTSIPHTLRAIRRKLPVRRRRATRKAR